MAHFEGGPHWHERPRRPLSLAFSPCPNDTFIFYAWVHGLVPEAPPVRPVLADIDRLNGMALGGETEVTKLSFGALAHVRDRYALLHAGGALGRGCGPLLVVREDSPARRAEDVVDGPLAVPGELTTAALLLRLRLPEAERVVVMPFDEIMGAVSGGWVQAGAIIHEGRFTYPGYGLRCLQDLGEWWEHSTGLPIPLGGIAVRRDLGLDGAAAVEKAVRSSVEFAWAHPESTVEYVRSNAQELDDGVCREHIALYVNEFSCDYGEEGRAAIEVLLTRAAGLGPGGKVPAAANLGNAEGSRPALFWDE